MATVYESAYALHPPPEASEAFWAGQRAAPSTASNCTAFGRSARPRPCPKIRGGIVPPARHAVRPGPRRLHGLLR